MMKNLEEIEVEVGKELFKRWKQHAEKECDGSPFKYRNADARHAYVFQEVSRRYKQYSRALAESHKGGE